MVNALSETALEYLSLKPSLQEILNLQSQHVIETHTALVEHTDTDQSADKGVTLEKTFGVFVIELEELTSCTTDFGKSESDTPDFALVAETVLSGELDKRGYGEDWRWRYGRTLSSASRRADSKGRRGTL
jgi:hypothetical protein